MNNKRKIRQKDFNNSLNGYYGHSDGVYATRVNGRLIGLEFWAILDYWSGLTYHIT